MNKSPTASVNDNIDDDTAEIVIPIEPDVTGKTKDAEIGVKLRPDPSEPIDDERVKYTVLESAEGRNWSRAE